MIITHCIHVFKCHSVSYKYVHLLHVNFLKNLKIDREIFLFLLQLIVQAEWLWTDRHLKQIKLECLFADPKKYLLRINYSPQEIRLWIRKVKNTHLGWMYNLSLATVYLEYPTYQDKKWWLSQQAISSLIIIIMIITILFLTNIQALIKQSLSHSSFLLPSHFLSMESLRKALINPTL